MPDKWIDATKQTPDANKPVMIESYFPAMLAPIYQKSSGFYDGNEYWIGLGKLADNGAAVSRWRY